MPAYPSIYQSTDHNLSSALSSCFRDNIIITIFSDHTDNHSQTISLQASCKIQKAGMVDYCGGFCWRGELGATAHILNIIWKTMAAAGAGKRIVSAWW
jgi:hypothetical protein